MCSVSINNPGPLRWMTLVFSSTNTFRDRLESFLISTPRHVHTCTTVTGIELSLAPAPRHSSPHVFPFPSRLSPRHRTGAFLSGISSLHGARYLLLLVPICGTRCASHDVLPLATRGPPLHRALTSSFPTSPHWITGPPTCSDH